MTDSDETLLKSFAIHGDESAFRELADRYLGLVFHTAVRRTRNHQMAEEVSQNILCALANKAPSLAKTPKLLPAWLHRATLYESSKAMRAESSHQRRKQLVHPEDAASELPTWIEALSHLDAALDQLPESDRRVLLLHFFENRRFPGIARSLGKSTAAIQKQSQRALEKLARLLRAKGITLTATAIATGLTAEFAKSAPVSLFQSATAAALAGSSAYSTTGLTLMFASKSKLLVPLVILLCLTPLAIQQVAISKEKDRSDFLHSQATSLHESASLPSRTHQLQGRGLSNNFDINVLVDECDEFQSHFSLVSRIQFKQKLAELDADTLAKLIQECIALPIHRKRKLGLLNELVVTLSRLDAPRAVKCLMNSTHLMNPGSAGLNSDSSFKGIICIAFAVWAKEDPLAALAWKRGCNKDSDFRGPMLNALVFNKSPELRAFLHDISTEERCLMFESALDDPSMYLYVPGNFADSTAELTAAYLPVLQEFIPESQHQHMLDLLKCANK